MSTLRASSLPLLTKCTGSLYLPCDDEPSEAAIEGAAWGSMVHHWKETGDVRGPDKRTENAFRKAIAASGADRLALWPAGGVHEQSVALRVDGVREAARNQDGRLTGNAAWVTGTSDFRYWFFDDELWIDDLKTGKYYPNPEPGQRGYMPWLPVGANRYPQRPDGPQPQMYALAESILLGYTGRVHVSITHWPRLPLARRHAPPDRFVHTWEHAQLIDFWGELERLHKDTELRPGDHCRFCPSRNYCIGASDDR